MLKKTFLKKLETSLSPLGEERVSKIIKKYDKLIDEEVAKGKDEKDVVSSLGSVDLISKIYLDDKDEVKTETKKTETSTSTVDSILDGVINFIDDTFKNVDRDLAKRILLILCFIFIGFMAISLIQIPFRIISYAGRNVLTYAFDNLYFDNVVGSLWSFGVGICFFAFIIWLIVKYVNKIVNRYTNNKFVENNSKKTTESIKEERVEEIKKDTSSTMLDVLYIVLKVFAVILTIPLIMMAAGLFITLFIFIALIINGVILYGPMIIILGLIIFVTTILNLIFDAIFKGGIK
jgi:uncharacterized membrane protein